MTIKDYNKSAIITPDGEVSYTQLLQRIRQYAEYVSSAEKTIVFAENSAEWVYAFFGIWTKKGIAVPVDATSTAGDLAYIINDCRPTAIWVSAATEGVAREAMASVGISLEILLLHEVTKGDCSGYSSDALEFTSEETGQCSLIIYTSGTTGAPKGVMLSYENLEANISGVADDVPIFNTERRALILLPVHHVLPLVGCVIAPITRGGGVAICPSLSGPDIMNMLARGRVGILIGVPRLWQTLFGAIKKKIDSNIVTRSLYNLCAMVNSRTLSRIIFSSVRKKMGGHLDFCVSGGAALDREIGKGLTTLGLDVLEGYGMTETAPIIAFTRPGDYIPGCSGKPLPAVETKIVDGELCARGRNLMLGYYNRPEETAAVIDSEGYIHTGDLATIDSEGRVTITGRKKEIIVLSNGKNVQPSEIEFQLEKYDTYVKEAGVTEKDDMLWAIIVPQPGVVNDEDLEQRLKTNVVQPYNRSVENYKKIMNIVVYHGDLPRTKLDKLQRFKLKDLLNTSAQPAALETQREDFSDNPVMQTLAQYIWEEKHIAVKATSHIETDLAFDSLDRVSMQGFVEQAFDVTIDADDMVSFKDLQAMADHISASAGHALSSHSNSDAASFDWHQILTTEHAELVLPMTSPTHTLYAKAFKAFFRFNNRLTIIGRENIPADGAVIFAPNHQSYVDGPLVIAGFTPQQMKDCYFYATEEHVKGALRRYLASHHNIILMERKNLKNSILKMAAVLNQKKRLCIFPEGSRTHDGSLTTFRKTFAILAKEIGVPIVPVCIKGAYESMPRGRVLPMPHHITVEYLPPVMPEEGTTYDDLATIVKKKIVNRLGE